MAVRGLSTPRRSVISSTAPAAVTAATTDTASPPRPLWLLPGSCRAASGSTASGAGHTAKVVTMAGRNDARPASQAHDDDLLPRHRPTQGGTNTGCRHLYMLLWSLRSAVVTDWHSVRHVQRGDRGRECC